ncbi:MAG: aa3-type cytochrome c oxidase subunit IV [Sphingomonas sp.]|nr:aa3-type cytochrome c oxidase subunit IV [Sphingomonas sp.]
MQDYSRFIALFKWGAIISFIIAMFVLFLIA